MRKWSVLQIAAVLLALAAAFVCQRLLDRHITGQPGPAWFEAGCHAETEAGGGANCAAVLASPWSYWPPVVEGDPPGKPRIPVAFLGLVYYGMLAVWFLGVGRPSHARRWVVLLPALIMILGLAGSGFFIYVMFTKLDAWCPWCMVTHVLNALLAICLVLLIPRKPRADLTDSKSLPSPIHPTWRLGAMTLVAMGLVIFGLDRQYGRAVVEKSYSFASTNLSCCLSEIKKIQGNGDLLLANFLDGEVHNVSFRPENPRRTLGAANEEPLQLVVFGDLECPPCRKIAGFIEKDVQRLFGGALAVVFKHYPIDQSCNPNAARTLHPYACAAARLAEASRELGGNRTFWKAHDYIYAHQNDLKRGRLDIAALAEETGIGRDELVAKMKTPEVAKQIALDLADARTVGVTGTPSIFINGRKVEALYIHEIRFWDKLADRYWQNRGEPRPAHTTLQALGFIQDNQGPKAAP